MLLYCCARYAVAIGERDADDRRDASDREVMRVRRIAADVALIDVVRPDRVEGRHVARHARHERCHQGGESHAEHPGWDRTAPSAS